MVHHLLEGGLRIFHPKSITLYWYKLSGAMKAEISLACSVRVTHQYPFNRSSFVIKIALAYFIDTVAYLGKGVLVGLSDRVHLLVVNAKLN